MLWAVRQELPSGVQFAFNWYRHWATLVIRAGDGTSHFLYSQEGVTHGYPLDMVAYGLGIPPLIRELYKAFPGVTQPWYVDDARAGVTFEGIRLHLDNLVVRGPLHGYSLEPTKSVLVMSPRNVPQEETFFMGYGLSTVTGSHYLRHFVGSKAAQDPWLGEKVERWQDSVATLYQVARRHPHTAYSGLQQSLQKEWAFVQRVTLNIRMTFQAV